MLKSYRHTIECTKCRETREMFEDIEDALKLEDNGKSKCCGAPYQYIGFQPYHESIIKIPEFMITSETNNLVSERDYNSVPNKVIDVKTTEVARDEYADIPQISEKTIFEPIMEETKIIPNQQPIKLKIEDVIQNGSRGINNSNMIPAIKLALEENSVEKIKLLKQTYPLVFNNSIRYLGKKYQDRLTILKI